ncbi:MAG TPA: c-type cytochrome [Chthoniobacterales bacterium]|nr:c-type cytochrome [Chthoniobacterales bacterium]
MKRILLTCLALILILFVVLGLTARLGWWPVSATAVPPQWEFNLAQSTLQASLSRQANGLTNPVSPSEEVLIAGLKSFKMNCAGCHGLPGQPSQWGTRNFYPRAPQFPDDPPHLSAPAMFVAIKHGIRYSGMGGWDGMMADEEIWKVATFLEHIGSLPPEVRKNWKPNQ